MWDVRLAAALLCLISRTPGTSQQQSHGPCDTTQYFKCDDGNCLLLHTKCNGRNDCPDASDELDTICALPNFTLTKGNVVAVFQQMLPEHEGIQFIIGDTRETHKIVLHESLTEAGKITSGVWSSCDLKGYHCFQTLKDHVLGKSFNRHVAFAAEHRFNSLAVWPHERPEQTVTVPISEWQSTLVVRPWKWATDMSVQFHDCWGCSTLTTTTTAQPECDEFSATPYRCQDGTCLRHTARCDGWADCPDASDEIQSTCSLPNMTLAKGQVIGVAHQMEATHEGIQFIIGDERETHKIVLHESYASDGKVVSGIFGECNLMGYKCFRTIKDHDFGRSFKRDVTFAVEHRGDQLAVWPLDRRNQVTTVPIKEWQTFLKIRPWRWLRNMPAQFIDCHGCSTLTAPASGR